MAAIDSPTVPPASFWCRRRADQMSVVANGSDYFWAAKEAMLQAKQSIMLIGWEFDARVGLDPADGGLDGPGKVGDFLNWLVKQRPDLEIRLLKWDVGMLRALGRGATPLFVLDWLGHRDVRLRLDSAHPHGAAHHTKLLVIDDVLAFCGGIDMTVGRWDTRAHREDEPHRKSPWGKSLPPWHDATTCISGDVVRDLGNLARERWQRATGEALQPPRPAEPIWPSNVAVQFRDLDIAIARTSGAFKSYPQVSEIETLTLHLIGAAQHTLYIENQYLASRDVAVALAERLKEPDGPQIVLIMPETADGWLQAKAMDSARSRLLDMLRQADHFDRFRAYFPANEAGTSVYVHAKVLIADSRYLKVGSANLNNRSMGLDSECDILVDAMQACDEEQTRQTILDCRAALLAEHLGVSPQAVEDALAEATSFIAALEAMNGKGRLRPVQARPLKPEEKVIAETDLVDPERPATLRDKLPNPLAFLQRGRD